MSHSQVRNQSRPPASLLRTAASSVAMAVLAASAAVLGGASAHAGTCLPRNGRIQKIDGGRAEIKDWESGEIVAAELAKLSLAEQEFFKKNSGRYVTVCVPNDAITGRHMNPKGPGNAVPAQAAPSQTTPARPAPARPPGR